MSVREYNAVAQEALSQPTTGTKRSNWIVESRAALAKGEWTPEFVMLAREGCEVAGVDFDTKIADAHNAALAAEREKYHV